MKRKTIFAALLLGIVTLAAATYQPISSKISGPPTPVCRQDCGQ